MPSNTKTIRGIISFCKIKETIKPTTKIRIIKPE